MKTLRDEINRKVARCAHSLCVCVLEESQAQVGLRAQLHLLPHGDDTIIVHWSARGLDAELKNDFTEDTVDPGSSLTVLLCALQQ